MTAANHVSKNRLSGSLLDTPVPRVLDACHKHLVTGWIQIEAGRTNGRIELRGGAIDGAEFGDLRGSAALERMRRLGDGDYEVVQRLPDLDGSLGSAAAFEGSLSDVSLVDLMRHCEDNALNCTITLIHDFDRGQIVYRLGEIESVEFNGVIDEDKIVDMVELDNARFLVSAPPLDIGIEGWPSVRRSPTAPFTIEHLVEASSTRVRDEASSEVSAEEVALPGMTTSAETRPQGKRKPRRLATGTGQLDAIPEKVYWYAKSGPATTERRTASGRTVPPRADTSSVITSARAQAIDDEFRPRRATWLVRFRLSLARVVAGQPIQPSVRMKPAGRRFERAAFALKRWVRG